MFKSHDLRASRPIPSLRSRAHRESLTASPAPRQGAASGELWELIAAHKAAERDFEAAFYADDALEKTDPRTVAAKALVDEKLKSLDGSVMAIFSHHCASIEEAQAKAAYLANSGDLEDEYTGGQMRALLESFLMPSLAFPLVTESTTVTEGHGDESTASDISGRDDLAVAIAGIEKARDEECPLGALIRAHTKASAHFEEVCDFDDYISQEDPSFLKLEAEYAQRNKAERAAMTAVCAYQARSHAEHVFKARFFLKYMDGGGELEENQLRVLWCSVLGERLAREALEVAK